MSYSTDNKDHFAKVLKTCGMGEFQKDIVDGHYNDAIEFLIDSGVDAATAVSEKSVGCVARYILDTYSYQGSDVKLSTFFFQRLGQLQAKCQGGGE